VSNIVQRRPELDARPIIISFIVRRGALSPFAPTEGLFLALPCSERGHFFFVVMEMEVQARSKYERLLVEESFPALRRGTVPTIFSALSYIKSTVGVGIFTLPFAIRSAGMWVGLLGFAFISVVAFYCVMLLVSIRVHRGCEDYAACGREALGTGGVFLANFAVISTQVGTHVVQAVFISGVLFHFVPAIPRYGWILLLSPVFVSLSWIRDVSHLRWPSMFGVLLLVAAVITVLIYGFLNLFPGDFIASQINHAPVDFFLFFGTSIYVFEGINMALPIHREMRHPESFGRMFFFVSLIMGVVFSGFAVCGYLSFLDVVRPIVVFNLPFNSGWLIAVSVLIIVELLLSFPLVFFPISWAVEHSIAPSLFPPT
jgi:amino acid permease